MKENLRRNYKSKYQDIEEKMKILEGFKHKGVTNNSSSNGKGKASGTGGAPKNGGGGGDKDDDS